jgi:ADP-ribose pyrophosphatase
MKILSDKRVYDGFFKLHEYELQMPSLNGEGFQPPTKREVFYVPDAAIVLIYVRAVDSFLLCEEYRTGVFFNDRNGDHSLVLQCAAGLVEEGHSPEETAKREALEEAGVVVDAVEPMTSTYYSPGCVTQKGHLFLATLEQAPESGTFGLAEEGEQIRTRLYLRKEIYKMMDEGKILDSMTLIALCWFRIRNP